METATQEEKRRECAVMREVFQHAEHNELRHGYLRNQRIAHAIECKRLGDVAGVTGHKNERGPDRFSHEDPSTMGVLIRTMQTNEQRNESEHAYVQSLDAMGAELAAEVVALSDEEAQLNAKHENAARAAAAEAARRVAQADEAAHATKRCAALEARLKDLRPKLSACMRRLSSHYDGLPPSDESLSYLRPVPARSVPKGLKPLPIEEAPLHSAMEIEMESLDALLQQMASRAKRVLCERLAEARVQEENGFSPEEKPPYEISPLLNMFTQLPAEVSFAELKAARADLETVVSRHKEVEGLDQ